MTITTDQQQLAIVKETRRLITIAREWRQYCICATSDDNAKMDTAIAKAQEAIDDYEYEREIS